MVDRVWQGVVGRETLVFTSQYKYGAGLTMVSSEDFHFEKDKKYLIYAYDDEGRLTTSGCTRTVELSEAGIDLKLLGIGRPVKAAAVL